MSNYYEILGLPPRPLDVQITTQDFKHAYRHALLRYHPDKALNGSGSAKVEKGAPTIDEITLAYKTLVEPVSRMEYDRALIQQLAQESKSGRVHQTGLETVDLDSLDFKEETQTWTRSCRCSDPAGFLVTEDELEKHIDDGELTVGCRGCSLWLRVLFSVEG